MRQILDATTSVPTILINDRRDVLAANALARELFADVCVGQELPNSARCILHDARARVPCHDWDSVARDVDGASRSRSRRSPPSKRTWGTS